MSHRYAIALGSNRRHGRHGAPGGVIAAALAALEADGMAVLRASPILPTPPLGPGGRTFANAAALIACELDPPALLARLKRIERRFGRRRGRRWGARVLDLDIILWNGGIWRSPGPGTLAVPHRAYTKRLFVLQPLAAIVPCWRDPRLQRTVRQLRARALRRSPVDRTRAAP